MSKLSFFSCSQQISRPTCIIPLLLSVASCTHLESLSDVAKRMDNASIAVLEPDRESQKLLSCVGRMLETFRPIGAPTLYIAIESYINKTVTTALAPQSIPLDMRSMLATSLNQISPQISFTDILRPVDAIQAHTLNILAKHKPRPALVLNGAALIVERATMAESSSFDIGFSTVIGSLRISRRAADAIAGIELDLNATYPDRSSEYGLSAPVRMLFERFEGTQNTGAASVQEVAIGVESVTRYTQSFGPALRLAIALQVSRIIGRWNRLPYWQCITDQPNVRPDEYVKRSYERQWEVLVEQHGLRNGYGWLQELLVYNGYKLKKTNRLDTRTRSSLAEFMRTRGLSFDENKLTDALWALIQGIPGQSDATLKKARRWEKKLSARKKRSRRSRL